MVDPDSLLIRRGMERPTKEVTVLVAMQRIDGLILGLDATTSRVVCECNLKKQGESLANLMTDMGPIAYK